MRGQIKNTGFPTISVFNKTLYVHSEKYPTGLSTKPGCLKKLYLKRPSLWSQARYYRLDYSINS